MEAEGAQPAKKQKTEVDTSASGTSFECPANECVTFHLVRTAADVDVNAPGFHPEFTHQVFGEHETVYGYKGLQ
eukprot:8216284-Pyramimonas_sp.AAC.1